MELSVIIVNYNVRFFLEQCLHSVTRALEGLSAEVFVVDNHSADGSCGMVREKFPGVQLIPNAQNLGFSTANNQAIRLSKGRYVLLLNPDTVVEEDSFRKVVAFMDQHPDAGGLGVKMIDGKGNFLQESKRGLPTPWVAFCKMTGLSALFPSSRIFGRYYLGFLNRDEVHSVDVLSGAFMLIRKETLNKTGLLDEAFFMYGEDIDLSYRISLAGYRNYYFPGTTIIHYKGESTRKSSVNYVIVFYKAMIIFAGKHFAGSYAWLLTVMITLAVYLRAGLAILHRSAGRVAAPLTDAAVILSGMLLIKPLWEQIRFDRGHYPDEFLLYAVPGFLMIWLAAIAFMGGYHSPVRLGRVNRGLLAGTVIILLTYSLLPESMRFSRAMILLGFLWNVLALNGWRYLLSLLQFPGMELHSGKPVNLLILGSREEALRVGELLKKTDIHFRMMGMVSPSGIEPGNDFLGDISQLEEIIQVNGIEELVFCSANMPAQEIIASMHRLSGLNLSFKIAVPESLSVIGSNSIETAGDLYSITNNSIGKSLNRRKKRLFDLGLTFIFFLLFPLAFPFFSRLRRFSGPAWQILRGKASWVGYAETGNNHLLPVILPGLFTPVCHLQNKGSQEDVEKLNLLYSKDYSMLTDLKIILKSLPEWLGK